MIHRLYWVSSLKDLVKEGNIIKNITKKSADKTAF